jgi:FAD:protein FMN transferase
MFTTPPASTRGRPLPRSLVALAVAALAAAALVGAELPTECRADADGRLARHEFRQVHMGAPFTIVLYAPDEAMARRAADAAFARIAELDCSLSDYLPESELSRLSATAGSDRAVRVSEDLWNVLAAAQRFARESDGAFDVTVGPYTRLWRRAARQRQLPPAERLEEAQAAVGWRHMELDQRDRSVRLARPGMRLDLGAIGKGYAADAALAVLARHGLASVLVDAGGDVTCGDPPPDERGWRIGVAPLAGDGPPQRWLLVARGAVATSGDAFQHVEIDGRRYSHLVDPRTGLGLTQSSSVTVIASNGTAADALASAVSVLGVQRGLRLVAQHEGVEALIIRRCDDGTIESCESPGWARFAAEPR